MTTAEARAHLDALRNDPNPALWTLLVTLAAVPVRLRSAASGRSGSTISATRA